MKFFKLNRRLSLSPVTAKKPTNKLAEKACERPSNSDRLQTAASRVSTRGSSVFTGRTVDESQIIKRQASYKSYHLGVNHVQIEATTNRVSDNSIVLGDTNSNDEVIVNFN